MNELKSCPCCGSPAAQRENKSGTKICIECENPDCGLRTGWFLTYSDALAAWDKRVKTTGQRMRIFLGGEELHPEQLSTHYEGCESVHPACKISRLEKELDASKRHIREIEEDCAQLRAALTKAGTTLARFRDEDIETLAAIKKMEDENTRLKDGLILANAQVEHLKCIETKYLALVEDIRNSLTFHYRQFPGGDIFHPFEIVYRGKTYVLKGEK